MLYDNLCEPLAEQAVLGFILLDNSKFIAAVEKLSSLDFYDAKNQHIFKAMQTLYDHGKPIELISLESCLKKMLSLYPEDYGDLKYLTSLIDRVPYTGAFSEWVELVKEASKKREIAKFAQSLFEKVLNKQDSSSLIEEIGNKWMKLLRLENTDVVQL